MVSTRSQATPAAAGTAAAGTPAKSSRKSAGGSGSSVRIPVLVTGGAGFLGKTLCRQLVESGKYDVTVFDIRPSGAPGVTDITGDLTNADQVERAVSGKSVVFHVATASPTGANARNRELMRKVNVVGTENILAACVKEGVPRLVFTSSASVVFDGTDLLGVDESRPYPPSYLDYYSQTKADAEKLVLQANGKGGLQTAALRPSAIFGEGDPLMVPSLVAQAKKGKTKFMIGQGKNVCDFTYVENIAYAHLLAADALAAPKSPAGGRAYFITNDEPRPFWTMMGDILQGLGYDRPRICIPALLLYFIASAIEFVTGLLRLEVNLTLTSFRVAVSSKNRHFSCEAAKRDLGYKPLFSMDDALKRTVKHFEFLRNPAAKAKGS